MNVILSNINWLVAIPLGLISLFFGGLGWRRGVRFFDHESNADQKERFRDLFLSTFDLMAAAFSLIIAISPAQLWLVMIPIGLGLLIFTIPISIVGSYYQLYFVSGFMPKNAGIKISALNEKTEGKISWYEFTPFGFILGWLMFFLVSSAVHFLASIVGKTQALNGLSAIIGSIVGIMAAVIVILGAFLKSKTG